jgi:LuxR family glucitol operon transcriptional activator
VQAAVANAGGNLRLATNQVLHRALTTLSAHHADEAALLRVRYLDAKTVHLLSIERNMAQATIYYQQQQAIGLLAAIIREMEQEARTGRRAALQHSLPQPVSTALVGVEEHLDRLMRLIMAPDGPTLLQVDGIGGSGKSALIDALLRIVIDRECCTDVTWLNAQRQCFRLDGSLRPGPGADFTDGGLMEELTRLLRTQGRDPAQTAQRAATVPGGAGQANRFVVLDDFEAVDDVAPVVTMIQRHAGASRFILISRRTLYWQPGIYHFRLPELSEVDALRLVRQEAELRNLPALAEASDDSLQPIYAAVGGNPLALRLVASQAHVHPMPVILGDLAAAQSEAVQSLYTYIYRFAWDSLDERARRVLLAMRSVGPEGGDPDEVAQASHVSSDALRQALGALVELNLVDCWGDLNHRHYSIRNLTCSFLQEQAARWKGS